MRKLLILLLLLALLVSCSESRLVKSNVADAHLVFQRSIGSIWLNVYAFEYKGDIYLINSHGGIIKVEKRLKLFDKSEE